MTNGLIRDYKLTTSAATLRFGGSWKCIRPQQIYSTFGRPLVCIYVTESRARVAVALKIRYRNGVIITAEKNTVAFFRWLFVEEEEDLWSVHMNYHRIENNMDELNSAGQHNNSDHQLDNSEWICLLNATANNYVLQLWQVLFYRNNYCFKRATTTAAFQVALPTPPDATSISSQNTCMWMNLPQVMCN